MHIHNNNVIKHLAKPRVVLKLILDEHNSVAVGDKPIFGSNVTLNEKLYQALGKTLSAGEVIGWVDYLGVDQFACLNHLQHYISAKEYLCTEQNQLKVTKPITILHFDENMNQSKALFEFAEARR